MTMSVASGDAFDPGEGFGIGEVVEVEGLAEFAAVAFSPLARVIRTCIGGSGLRLMRVRE